MFTLLLWLAAAAYVAAGIFAWRHLRTGAPLWPAQAAVAAALALHIAALGPEITAARGVAIGVGGALSLFAWQTALLLFLFNLRQPVAVLGMAIYPIAGACALIGAALPAGATPAATVDWPLQVHILLSMLAYGLLSLGAAQALVLAIQHRQLHERRPGGLPATLPPLQTMERTLFQLIRAGFFLLTLAIVSGLVFIDDLFAQHLAHKTILSLFAWLLFAVLLWGRWRFGWRGRMAVRWTLGGYALLILAYFGSKMALEMVLGRHW